MTRVMCEELQWCWCCPVKMMSSTDSLRRISRSKKSKRRLFMLSRVILAMLCCVKCPSHNSYVHFSATFVYCLW